ncbi:COP23 domain-containing protein [Nostoc sp. FACHB-133]|uniref:COP23 domain-containing protein n=1 Tax=Nostoc sp. FACHB-133 TaxID=2692835 RepID=UPI0016831C15|nr:COP23 domain-containing protein [Nostoc sp. FACHB-133]MBD2527269.1 hypothetical protein [Nostoc sp. FACHB-133]
MRFQQYASTIAASLMGFISASAINGSTLAQSATSTAFFCQVINGIPNTVARIKDTSNNVLPKTSEQIISILEWTRNYYPESQESSLNRCVRVSSILQTYNQKGKLNYITSGEMDGKRVVCATSSQGSPCSRLLFILEPSENSAQVVADLRLIINKPQVLVSKRKLAIFKRWKQPPLPPGLPPGGKVRAGGSR